MKEVYISVDIEAAGPVPAVYSMLSLGAVVVHDLQTNFYTEFRPNNRKSLPDAMKVVGRTLKDYERAGRDPKEAMIAFRDWIDSVAKNSKPIFIGFNMAFRYDLRWSLLLPALPW